MSKTSPTKSKRKTAKRGPGRPPAPVALGRYTIRLPQPVIDQIVQRKLSKRVRAAIEQIVRP